MCRAVERSYPRAVSEDPRQPEQTADDGSDSRPDESDAAATPFDHPLFLPVILAGLTLWFGYDGFLNQDADMREHLTFNRVGFAILIVLTGWYGYRGLREFREEQAERSSEDSTPQ